MSWSATESFPQGNAEAVHSLAAAGTTVYAAGGKKGVLVTTDAGKSWRTITPSELTQVNVLSLALSSTGVLYMGASNDQGEDKTVFCRQPLWIYL